MLLAGIMLMASAYNITSGQDLYEACKEPGFNTFCDGFVKGLMDAIAVSNSNTSERSCLPRDLGMRLRRTLMLEYLNQHPEQWNLSAVDVVNRMIAANWPDCHRKL